MSVDDFMKSVDKFLDNLETKIKKNLPLILTIGTLSFYGGVSLCGYYLENYTKKLGGFMEEFRNYMEDSKEFMEDFNDCMKYLGVEGPEFREKWKSEEFKEKFRDCMKTKPYEDYTPEEKLRS